MVDNKKKTVAIIVINPIRSPYKNDQYDSFKSEGRIPINMGFGLSLLGFDVNIIMEEWEIENCKNVFPNVCLSKLPIHRHYNYVLTWDLQPLDRLTFDTLIFMDWSFIYTNKVSEFIKNTNSNVIYTINNKGMFNYSQRKNQKKPINIHYLCGLYPIPSYYKNFIPYTFDFKNKKDNVLTLYIYYNVLKGSDKFKEKIQLIIDFFKNKDYKIKLNLHAPSEYDLNEDINPFKENTNYIYDTKHRYIDVLNVIKCSEICITSGSHMSSSSLHEVLSQGNPMIYISDNEININKHVYTNDLYEHQKYLLNIHENKSVSLLKLEKFIINPKESYDKFKDAFKDIEFKNWKIIAEKYFIK